MKPTILVVGGTGMLGEPVARQLLADGYAVRILSRNPQPAREKLGASFEIVRGDVEDSASLERALAGCAGVHINLMGGPRPEEYDRIEHLGAANVARAAATAGVERLTYLSGAPVSEENLHDPGTQAKFHAEAAIRASGVPYTIFRATWIMESLPLFIRGKRAIVIGRQPHPLHWVAAADYADQQGQHNHRANHAADQLVERGERALSMNAAVVPVGRLNGLFHFLPVRLSPLYFFGVLQRLLTPPAGRHRFANRARGRRSGDRAGRKSYRAGL